MSSPVIPREKLSAYQRWELHCFDDVAESKVDEEPEDAAADKERHIHEHAYQAGLAEGLKLGTQQAAQDVERLQELLAGIGTRNAENEHHAAGEVLALSLEIARQMTRRALKVRPELIVPVIEDALARITGPVLQPRLTLHPEDAKLAREHLREQLAAGGWSVIEDPQALRGGGMLHTAGSQIDASAATRWRQVTDALGQDSEWLE